MESPDPSVGWSQQRLGWGQPTSCQIASESEAEGGLSPIRASPGRRREGPGLRTGEGPCLAFPGGTLGERNLSKGGWGRLGPLPGMQATPARDAMAPAPASQGEEAWLGAPNGSCGAASSTSNFVQNGLNKAVHGRANQAELGMGLGQRSTDLNLNHNPNFPKGHVYIQGHLLK